MNDEIIDVFISRKSADANYAKQLYDYLTKEGLNVFESDHTLKELGNAEYIKAIDSALERTSHLMVVASSREHMLSSWVEAEWLFFLNRKRSGKANGNLFTVSCSDMSLDDIPASLQNYEVIPFNKKNFPIIFNYCRREEQDGKKAPPNPGPFENQGRGLRTALVALSVLLLFLAIITTYMITRPFDATVFLKEADVNISDDYPSFEKGALSLFIEGVEQKKEVLSNGEVNYRQLPYAVKNEWVKATYYGKYWMLAKDSVLLTPDMTITVAPNGSLAQIYGLVSDSKGNLLSEVNVQIDTDTLISSDENGIFSTKLPLSMQKDDYTLVFYKEGYSVSKEKYYPESGKIEVQLNSIEKTN